MPSGKEPPKELELRFSFDEGQSKSQCNLGMSNAKILGMATWKRIEKATPAHIEVIEKQIKQEHNVGPRGVWNV